MLDHIADIDSDFSVFHGIRNPRKKLSAPKYFSLAYRLAHYRGAMRDHVTARHNEQQDIGKQSEMGPRRSTPAKSAGVNPATAGLMETNPSTAGLIEWD
jgi:hypothetical protein